MSNHSALFTSVLENPADDTTRLVLADLLRESDDPHEQARGRFLWAGVMVAHFNRETNPTDPICRSALDEITASTKQGYPARCLSLLGLGPSPFSIKDWPWEITLDQIAVRCGQYEGVFTRGMLSELTLTLGEWYEVGTKALALWPLDRIVITDAPGLIFTICKSGNEWELDCGLELEERGVQPTDSDPDLWVIRETYPDRQSLVKWIARDSEDLMYRLNQMMEEQ